MTGDHSDALAPNKTSKDSSGILLLVYYCWSLDDDQVKEKHSQTSKIRADAREERKQICDLSQRCAREDKIG